jgi:secondary thiamine-phosphate synthase enzyme
VKQALRRVTFATGGKGLTNVTEAVLAFVAESGIGTGLLTVWCCHTSASLTVQENADPTVRKDIASFFETLVPEHDGHYAHDDEGADDMPAHLRSMLTDTSLSVPVEHGRPVLGMWQAIYLFEHRRQPHRRELVLHLFGE